MSNMDSQMVQMLQAALESQKRIGEAQDQITKEVAAIVTKFELAEQEVMRLRVRIYGNGGTSVNDTLARLRNDIDNLHDTCEKLGDVGKLRAEVARLTEESKERKNDRKAYANQMYWLVAGAVATLIVSVVASVMTARMLGSS